jgi:hypothetical protein
LNSKHFVRTPVFEALNVDFLYSVEQAPVGGWAVEPAEVQDRAVETAAQHAVARARGPLEESEEGHRAPQDVANDEACRNDEAIASSLQGGMDEDGRDEAQGLRARRWSARNHKVLKGFTYEKFGETGSEAGATLAGRSSQLVQIVGPALSADAQRRLLERAGGDIELAVDTFIGDGGAALAKPRPAGTQAAGTHARAEVDLVQPEAVAGAAGSASAVIAVGAGGCVIPPPVNLCELSRMAVQNDGTAVA